MEIEAGIGRGVLCRFVGRRRFVGAAELGLRIVPRREDGVRPLPDHRRAAVRGPPVVGPYRGVAALAGRKGISTARLSDDGDKRQRVRHDVGSGGRPGRASPRLR